MNEQLNERRSAIDNTKAVIAHAQFLVVRVRAGVDLQRTLPTALRCAHLCCSAVRRSVRRGHSLAPSLAGSGFHSYHNTTPCKTWKGSSHNSRPKIRSSRRPRLSMRRLSTALIHAPSRGLFLGPAHVCLQALRCPPEAEAEAPALHCKKGQGNTSQSTYTCRRWRRWRGRRGWRRRRRRRWRRRRRRRWRQRWQRRRRRRRQRRRRRRRRWWRRWRRWRCGGGGGSGGGGGGGEGGGGLGEGGVVGGGLGSGESGLGGGGGLGSGESGLGGGGGEGSGLAVATMRPRPIVPYWRHAALRWTCPPRPSIATLPASTPNSSPQSAGVLGTSAVVAPSCASRLAEKEPAAALAATCTPGLCCCGIQRKTSRRHAWVAGCWRRLRTFL
jgi:hypothetical protein